VTSPAITLLLVGVVSVCAGALASVAGFGVGSLLTPLLAVHTGTKLAVAAVSVPHVAATALRFAMLREHVDRRLLRGFGLASAAGGLAGALLHNVVGSALLGVVFGGLLVFSGVMGLTGTAGRLRLEGPVAWMAGALSGLLGGLVGNQGGIRSAAMLGFEVPKQSFVATATAVALMVDGARLPVYLVAQGKEIATAWPMLAAATTGVLVGTVFGERILRRVPEPLFRRVVSAVILALGVFMLAASPER
jgi:hypothetical protein